MNIEEFMVHCEEKNISSITRKIESENEMTIITIVPDNYKLVEKKISSDYDFKPSLTIMFTVRSKNEKDCIYGEDVLMEPDIRSINNIEYDCSIMDIGDGLYSVSLTQKKIKNQNIKHAMLKDSIFVSSQLVN